MNKLVNWFADNPIAANLLMVVILIGGLSGVGTIDKEVQPTYQEAAVLVSLVYPGAGPREIEQQICVRVEEAVKTLRGIDEITCTARPNQGLIKIEATDGYSIIQLLNDVKSRVDAISSFPANVERPIIEQSIFKIQVNSVAVLGDTSERVLKEFAYQIKDELAREPGVPEIEIRGVRNYEVTIEVDESSLRRYGLSFDAIAQAVRSHSANMGGGVIRAISGEIQIQARNQAYTRTDFESIPVLSDSSGKLVRIGDLANVRDEFVDTQHLTRINGKSAVLLTVYASENPDVLAISAAVKAFIKKKNKSIPKEFSLQIWQDNASYFIQRLNTLVKNGIGGLSLVLIILLLFLRPALAAWVAVGIGVAFIGSLLALPMVNTSINVMSLFAYVMVLGIVVDDAIIIGESIYTQQQRGIYGVKSAQLGANMMARPVFFAVLTSIIVFIPLLLLPGEWAYFLGPIAVVPILVLGFSLIESCLILPAHLAHLKPEKKRAWFPPLRRLRNKVEQGFRYFIVVIYRPFLRRRLANRGSTLAGFLVFFVLSVSLVIGGWVKVSLPPDVALDFIRMEVTFPDGIPFQEVERVAVRMEEAVRKASDEASPGLERLDLVENFFIHANNKRIFSIVELAPKFPGRPSAGEFNALWQKHLGPVLQAEKINTVDRVTFDDSDLELRIYGLEANKLKVAAEWVKTQLAQYKGMHTIQDSLLNSRPELEISPHTTASTLGVSLYDIARQLRQAYYGEEAQRIPRGREDVKVMIKYPQQSRADPNSLQDLRIRTDDGRQVPLWGVADSRFVNGFSQIKRVDGNTSAEITANYDNDDVPLQQVMTDFRNQRLPEFQKLFPDMSMKMGGEQEAVQSFVNSLMRFGFIAILIIYGLLAVQFRSMLHPLLIILAIPFSVAGIILAHLITGQNLNLLSMLGILAATGVVVNDTLVLLDHTNKNRKLGLSITYTIILSAKNRFRPIFLTSLTTFFSLIPIMLETSLQAQFLIPMATSLAFGVMTASVVSLVFIPCAYSLGYDIKNKFRPVSLIKSKFA